MYMYIPYPMKKLNHNFLGVLKGANYYTDVNYMHMYMYMYVPSPRINFFGVLKVFTQSWVLRNSVHRYLWCT